MRGKYKEKTPIKCAGCGKIFTPKRVDRAVLCGDKQCRTEYMSRVNKMENTVDRRTTGRKRGNPHPAAPRKRMNGIDSNRTEPAQHDSQRRTMYRRVKLIECAYCGANEKLKRQFIDGNKTNFDLENIIVLCPSCRRTRADK